MKVEFFLNLCFIRVCVDQEQFIDETDKLLKLLFSGIGAWTINGRQEGQLDVVLAEVNGIWGWETEEMIFDYLEKEAPPQFWEWLQGCQIQLDVKAHAECSHCGK